MTPKDVEGLASAVVDTMKEALDRRDDRLAALARRVDMLESRPTMKFAGPWERGRSFDVGDVVQHQSALWICQAPTPGPPAEDFVGWKLLQKSPRR